MSSTADLEARVAELEATVRDMQALAKGEPGRDGKDGRDGRDGKSIRLARLMMAVRNALGPQRAPSVHVDSHVQVQPAPVAVQAAGDVHLPALQSLVHVSPIVHAQMQPYQTRTKFERDERGELIESTTKHEG